MRSRFLITFLVLYIQLLGQSCDSLQLVNRTIRASETDANISWELSGHQVYYNPLCTSINSALVYLVGSYDSPSSTVKFPALAANNGYHVIVLKYQNDVAAKTACSNSLVANCYENFRQEILTGTDVSTEVAVDSTNSIVNRLEKLFLYLDQNYPSENWGQYMKNAQIDWTKIVVAGHSQGGGHAAYIAKTNLVEKAIFFASPNDYSSAFNRPAPWFSGSWISPKSSLFGFNNLQDDVVPFNQQKEVWDSVGFSNTQDTTLVDQQVFPYLNAHYLYTNNDLNAVASDNHSVMIRDAQVPLSTTGKPVYEDVWRYLLGISSVTFSGEEVVVKNAVTVFPNPAGNLMQLQSQELISRWNLLNSTGKSILEKEKISANNIQLDLASLIRGVYFLSVFLENSEVVHLKVIKE